MKIHLVVIYSNDYIPFMLCYETQIIIMHCNYDVVSPFTLLLQMQTQSKTKSLKSPARLRNPRSWTGGSGPREPGSSSTHPAATTKKRMTTKKMPSWRKNWRMTTKMKTRMRMRRKKRRMKKMKMKRKKMKSWRKSWRSL